MGVLIMTKEEFALIVTKKIDEAIELKQKSEKEIEFYESLYGINSEQVEKSRQNKIYAELLIKELLSIVMLPVYEKINCMNKIECEEYKRNEIRELEEAIKFGQKELKSNETIIVNLEKEKESLINKYSETNDNNLINEAKKIQQDIDKIKELNNSYKLNIKNMEEKIIKLQSMTTQEIKEYIIEKLGINHIKTFADKKYSDEVDLAIAALKDKPELSDELSKEIMHYKELRERTQTESSILEETLVKEIPDFKNIVNNTKNTDYYTRAILVHNQEDFKTIRTNIGDMSIEFKNIIAKNEQYSSSLKNIDYIKNTSIIYMQKEDIDLLKKECKLYGIFEENEEVIDLLYSILNRFQKISTKKFIKTQHVREEESLLKKQFYNIIRNVITKLIDKICKLIVENLKKVGTGYLEISTRYNINDLETMNLNKIDFFILTDFLRKYNKKINSYIDELNELSLDLENKEREFEIEKNEKEDSLTMIYLKIQALYKEATGTNNILSPICFDTLKEKIDNKMFEHSKLNLEVDETKKDVKNANTDVKMSVDELYMARKQILDYLKSKNLEEDYRRLSI